MKQLKYKLIALLCLGTVLCAFVLPVTLGWFVNTLHNTPGITSYIHKSYFESGDGTTAAQWPGTGSQEGYAFEIKYPVQLYYFAWLQALGYFNAPNDDGTAINQVYFYLSADLDMTGWTLPQIGTQTYPFVGNFDGNGHTISNLTVQNVETSGSDTWNDKPEDITGLNIIGFFGVVGELGSTGSVNGYTYSSAINEIKNFSLNNVNIKTETANSLIGIAAGYVNGTVSNVQVAENGSITKAGTAAALTEYTSNLSDYTLVGYVTDPYKDTSDVVFAKVGTPTEENSHFNYMSQGAAAGWGGSIDMADMYQRLIKVRNNVSNITGTNHTATVTRRYSADGNLLQDNPSTGTPSDDFYRIYTAANNGSGQYVFSYYDTSTKYNYLSSTYKDVIEIHETYETVGAFYIQHNGTYLNLNNNHNGITNTTPTGGNTKWIIDGSNHIYTQDNDGVKYYLNANNNALAIGDTGTTAWVKSADALRNGNNGPYLQYDNGWRLIADGETAYYHISYTTGGTTYYLNENNGAIQRGTTATTKWYRSGTGTGTLSTVSANGNTYYLYTNGSNGNLSLQTGLSTTWTFNNN